MATRRKRPRFTPQDIAKFEQMYLGQLPIVTAILATGDDDSLDLEAAAAAARDLIDSVLDELENEEEET